MYLLSFLKRRLFDTAEEILYSIFGIVTLHLNALIILMHYDCINIAMQDMFPRAFTASGLQQNCTGSHPCKTVHRI